MKTFISFLLSFFFFLVHLEAAAPAAIYLTWQQHPESTMVIHWITPINSLDDSVEYRLEGDSAWHKRTGDHHLMPDEQPYQIHHCELNDLKSDSPYQFRIVSDGKSYKFRTLPAKLDAPLKFVVGGDIYTDTIKNVEDMNKQAARLNPAFALLGGDIAYTSSPHRRSFLRPGKKENVSRWLEWLSVWQKTMVKSDGCLIPFVPAIGNHETMGHFHEGPEQALFFYALFPIPKPDNAGYHCLDFSNYMSIFILDSEHTHAVKGNQKNWLDKAMASRRHTPHKFALYHVGAYPSIRDFKGEISQSIRKEWVPIFERYRLHAAFEHHDHAYKRTHLIRHNKVDSEGVLYLGDGAWGCAAPRVPSPKPPWYIAKALSRQHVILVTIQEHKHVYQAIDVSGNTIDEFIQHL